MRIVVAACTVDYAGRLSASLPEARRLLVVKADGSVLVHADSGGYKPLNWMTGPCVLVDSGDAWEVTNAKGERLTITFTGEVAFDSSVELGAEPGLELVRREHATSVGPVDLLCRDADGCFVAVEIKRRGEIAGVEQLARYVEMLERDGHTPVRGVLAAQKIVPQARTLAEVRALGWIEIDYDRLRGLGAGTPTLF